jgi:hypothetical protein
VLHFDRGHIPHRQDLGRLAVCGQPATEAVRATVLGVAATGGRWRVKVAFRGKEFRVAEETGEGRRRDRADDEGEKSETDDTHENLLSPMKIGRNSSDV